MNKNISEKKIIGKRLKESRLYLRYTQEQYGEQIGLNKTQIKDRETGITKIKLSEARIIESVYNISSDWLLTGQGNMLISKAAAVAESPGPYAPTPPAQPAPQPTDPPPDSYLSMTAAVLNTNSIFSSALRSNIEAFHSSIKLQQDLAAARAMLNIHDSKIKAQTERLNTLEDLIKRMEEKKAG